MLKKFLVVFGAGVVIALGGAAVVAAVSFLFGWFVYLLWNALVPAIFGLNPITYWQGVGLFLLSSVLVRSSSGSVRS